MRYLYLLFFCFLSLHSYLVFAQDVSEPVCPGGAKTSTQLCSISAGQYCGSGGFVSNIPSQTCGNETLGTGTAGFCYTKCGCRDGKTLQAGFCKCPTGTNWDSQLNSCKPIACPDGQIPNTQIIPDQGNVTTCIDQPDTESPPEECPNGIDPLTGHCANDDLCPSGYPKVDGQCPVCIGDYNEDGTCATPSSEPASSAPNSSSPDTGSSGSAGGDGGDDGGGTPGGGGDGPGNGGDNGGGGSAASASSASGGGASSGTNNSWNPYSGYGNWIPIAPDSPCPNKYQDVSGQWWCAGNGLGASSGSSASSAGSNGSESSGSADSNSSGSSTSSSCPAKPVCQKNTGIEANDQNCKKLLQEYFSACPGNPTENGLFDIDKDELGEGRPLTFQNSLEDFKTSMSESQNVQAIDDFFSFNGSGSCPVWQVQVLVFNVVIDQQCSPNIPWDLIRGIIIAVAVLLAARIALH